MDEKLNVLIRSNQVLTDKIQLAIDTSTKLEDARIRAELNTEKLLWNGTMPHFPGMGYPLVPGYESVGRVIEAGPKATGGLPTPAGRRWEPLRCGCEPCASTGADGTSHASSSRTDGAAWWGCGAGASSYCATGPV